MPATIEQIVGFLQSDDIKVTVDGNLIHFGFHTKVYRNLRGEPGLFLTIVLEKLEHDGEFLRVVAPALYKYPDGPHKAAVFQLLLMISFGSKMVQYEYDPRDGEIRAMIELPIADSTLTKRQLMVCLQAITVVTEEGHEAIVAAMTKGELPKPAMGEEQMRALWEEFQRFLAERNKTKPDGHEDHGLPE